MTQRSHRNHAFIHWFSGDECFMLIPYKDKQVKVVIDKEDYEEVCQYKWRINIHQTQRSAAVCASVNGQHITLAAFVLSLHNMKLKKGLQFSRQNALDNRKGTLKHFAEPCISGVYYHKGYNCWIAEICKEGACYSLGKFSSYEAAVKARLDAEESTIASNWRQLT